ncbi:MAG: hypothetical protein GY697_15565, partial [Desulfobacterales bacterium]|nr:hypothetical protein [Desulfobacterales bacterium]
PSAMAEPETVRFTPDCEFTVTFPGKISTKTNKGAGKSDRQWLHVRDIEFLAKHYEISAICRPIDPRGREYELLMFYRNMEKEARRVQIAKPQTAVKQDRKHSIVLGEWKGDTRDYAKKPVTVEGRYVLGRQSKLLLMVATPGAHPEPSALVADFFKSVRIK